MNETKTNEFDLKEMSLDLDHFSPIEMNQYQSSLFDN